MKSKRKSTESLDAFVDRNYGKRGVHKREILESGYEHFKVGALLQQARLDILIGEPGLNFLSISRQGLLRAGKGGRLHADQLALRVALYIQHG